MEMDIQYFITFRAAARSQSLTKAAEQLNYAQPTVSVQIKKLETHFGVKLFERNSNKLKLTDAGWKMLKYADQIVEGYLGAENVFTPGSAIDLTIGTTETLAAFLLPPYFQKFRKKYPDVSVTFFPALDEANIRKLKNNEIDLAIVLNALVSDPDLRTFPIRHEPFVFICPPNHPLSGRNDVSIQELHNSSFIFTEKGCNYRESLERSMNEHGVAYKTVTEMGSIEGIKQCVIYGMGIAMIPLIAVHEQLQQNLLSSFSLRPSAIQPFYSQILISRNKHISAPINDLISLLSSESLGY
ncbi:MAG: LysR family transcriptional regulator [Cohnella sp.]|jgi:DNA-binding transcriptional LysR family regulator|nr:MAG: LysR family transcriptional regulator [Cohnella sp.]